MTDFDFERFKADYTYFLSDKESDVILEYAIYHMFKWIRRLKIPINRDEVRGIFWRKMVSKKTKPLINKGFISFL
jgi:hypothetical protein